jgi:phage tail-like protein
MSRVDPYRGFRFLVEIEGITSGAFARVKGLSRELKRESYHEGGVNDYEHQLISLATHPVVILERGLTATDLWQWARDAADGDVARKKVTVRLNNEAGEEGWVWHIDWAIPVKWSCGDLDANSSQVSFESLELAHHGLRRGA